uniref:hypothetical protein n=1 Tax=uncultured Allisonella sp. TaxID=339338 RepID=UPI0025953E49|nr:hypothetical protein [uncultured Allisonella sp.]
MKKIIMIVCLIAGLIVSGTCIARAENAGPKVAVFLAGAKSVSKNQAQLDELYSKIPLFADAMHGNLIPVEKANSTANDYILDNKIDRALSTSGLIALGDKLGADYIVYEQFYPNAVHGGGAFHPSVRVDGDLTIRVFSAKEQKDVYTDSVNIFDKKIGELREEMLAFCDKSVKAIQAMPYITSGK